MNKHKINLLLSIGDAISERDRRFVSEHISANFIFTDSLGQSLEAIFFQRPKIVIIASENLKHCKDSVNAFRKQNSGLIIIAMGNFSESEIKLLKEELFIFSIISPNIEPEELIQILQTAITYYEDKKIQLDLREQSESQMGVQAQWRLWRESQEKLFRMDFAKSLIRNILHSASQGLGIGAMLTYIELLQLGMKDNGNRVDVDKETFNLLVQNSEATNQWLVRFENILSAFNKKYERESIEFETLMSLLGESISNTEKFRTIRGHEIATEEIQLNGKFFCNKEVLRDAIGEILLNAFKYSPPHSRINITGYATEEYAALMVLNDIEIMNGGITGIPVEYQTRIFEPFSRLNNTWDDRYREQKFGLGIGLSVAAHSLQQCRARLHVYEIEVHSIDHTSKPIKRIAAEIRLPRVA